MPLPPEIVRKNPRTVGARVRAWREYRGLSRKELAKRVDYSGSGLSDLELDRSRGSEKLHLIAAELGLNPHYVETGIGEPEAEFPQERPPMREDWPLSPFVLNKLKKLNKIERGYLEVEVLKLLNEIESERRNKSA